MGLWYIVEVTQREKQPEDRSCLWHVSTTSSKRQRLDDDVLYDSHGVTQKTLFLPRGKQ
jgi:hypothetical protein